MALGLTAATLLAVSAWGCGGARIESTPQTRVYPEPGRQAEVLNIQVFRNGTRLEMTNTTARRLEPSVMWVNRWWSRPIGGLDPGQSLTVPLNEFVDRFGEAFRAGGFFATRDPDAVVQAQLEIDGRIYGLVVVENRIQ